MPVKKNANIDTESGNKSGPIHKTRDNKAEEKPAEEEKERHIKRNKSYPLAAVAVAARFDDASSLIATTRQTLHVTMRTLCKANLDYVTRCFKVPGACNTPKRLLCLKTPQQTTGRPRR